MNRVDQVKVQMDYAIIQYFSDYLYASPGKAIEELICNGFDAWARTVRIYLDGRFGKECVIVWDDGESMDIDGLKKLWHIAKSPKRDRRFVVKQGQTRTTIGKFGIGKLASYSVGSKITHLCRQEDEFYLLEVDFTKMQETLETKDQGIEAHENSIHPYLSPIYNPTRQEAYNFLKGSFAELPSNFEQRFDEKHWTTAIVSGLKNVLPTSKRLKWSLGFAMPLRPDFKVWLDEDEIISHRGGSAEKTWDFSSPEVQNALLKIWKDDDLDGVPTFGTEVGLNPENPSAATPYVELPKIEKVWGEAKYYSDSLLKNKDYGRSYGVFLMVHERLVNVDKDRVFLRDPSFGVFYRSQYYIYCNAVDDELLADREEIKKESRKSCELSVVERALYRVTTDYYQKSQETDEAQTSWLPTFSRDYFVSPMLALLAEQDLEWKFPVDSPQVKLVSQSRSDPLVRVTAEGFDVNSAHPYIETLLKQVGSGKRGRQALKEFQKVAVSEALFHGYMIDAGFTDEQIKNTLAWRDELYRAMSQVSRSDVEQMAKDLEAASYQRGEDFEIAIADVLTAMGLVAQPDGASGQKDVLVVAPCGDQESYTFTFEAKAKNKGALPNDQAEVSGANNHRKKACATHAVIVAREFAGFKRSTKEMAAILEECEAIRDPNVNEGKNPVVSIMTTHALSKLLQATNEYKFSLDVIKSVFTTLESPEEKLETIGKLENPFQTIQFPRLLEFLYAKQQAYKGKAVPIRTIWIEGDYDNGPDSEQELQRTLEALEIVARPLMQIRDEGVFLRQSPEKILELIEVRMAAAPDSNT